VTRLATIGVYGWDAERFAAALRRARIDELVDVRRRRGVRGPQYAWANARRLQALLADAGVGYRHELELAPTRELLALQHGIDASTRTPLRARARLAPEYVEVYEREILGRADLTRLAEAARARTLALFCVERDPAACHRSLLADRLAAETGLEIEHLTP
jgi:uncharacterized protein (DUF488 family)